MTITKENEQKFDLSLLKQQKTCITLPVSGSKIELKTANARDVTDILKLNEQADGVDVQEEKHKILERILGQSVLGLSLADYEYVLMAVMSESSKQWFVPISCENKVDGEYCEEIFEASYGFDDVQVTEAPNNHIQSGVVTLVLKSPTVSQLYNYDLANDSGVYKLAKECLDYIVYENTNYYVDESELDSFFDKLSFTILRDLSGFFNSLQQISVSISAKCPKCRHEESMNLTGIAEVAI